MTTYERPFGRYLEDFAVGDIYRHWPGKTITEYDDHLFCMITMNHHPLHTNEWFAEHETVHGKNVVVGNLVYSLVLGMSVPDVSGAAIANLEVESLTHKKPTFHGDTIYAETRVLDVVESSSKPDRGIVTVETKGLNQRGEEVCYFRRKVMVWKREAAPVPPPPLRRDRDLGRDGDPGMSVNPTAASGFGAGAEAYERGRPSYPDAAVAHLVEVLRLGAGQARARPRGGHRQDDAPARAVRRRDRRGRAGRRHAHRVRGGGARCRDPRRHRRGDPAARCVGRRGGRRAGLPLVRPRQGARRDRPRPSPRRGSGPRLEPPGRVGALGRGDVADHPLEPGPHPRIRQRRPRRVQEVDVQLCAGALSRRPARSRRLGQLHRGDGRARAGGRPRTGERARRAGSPSRSRSPTSPKCTPAPDATCCTP